MIKFNKKMMTLVATLALCFSFIPMVASATNYYQNWDNGVSPKPSYTNGSGGNFSVTWNYPSNTGGNVVTGKGWTVGNASRVMGYNAGIYKLTSGNDGCSYLGAYGWTKNPLIEWYVTDSWFNWRPVYGSSKGTVSSDGGTYDIYKNTQVNQPSISGTATFDQYWSVRTSTRTQNQNNTITFANHVAAWSSKGLNLGSTWDYQMIAVEGYQSAGQANVTAW